MEKDREKPEYNNINSKIYFKIKNNKKKQKNMRFQSSTWERILI